MQTFAAMQHHPSHPLPSPLLLHRESQKCILMKKNIDIRAYFNFHLSGYLVYIHLRQSYQAYHAMRLFCSSVSPQITEYSRP